MAHHPCITIAALVAAACVAPASPGPSSATSATSPRAAPAPEITIVPPSPGFAHGVVVNHWLSGIAEDYLGQSGVPHVYGAPWFDEEDVAWIARHGFDHVLLLVSVTELLAADGTIDAAKLAPVQRALDWMHRHRLGTVLAFTRYPPAPGMAEDWLQFATEPARAHFAALAGKLARQFASEDATVRFKLGARFKYSPNLNAAYRGAIAAVRVVSPTRFVYLAPGEAPEGEVQRFGRIAELEIPDAHCGAAPSYWYEASTKTDETPAPAASSNATEISAELVADFRSLSTFRAGRGRGREIYISDFGVLGIAESDPYLRAVTDLSREHRVGWAIYDYESGCAVRGPDGEPTAQYEVTGLRPGAARVNQIAPR